MYSIFQYFNPKILQPHSFIQILSDGQENTYLYSTYNYLMGATVNTEEIIQVNYEVQSHTGPNEDKKYDKDYDIQVIEICNTALAIKNKEHTISVQLSLRCEGLPPIKAFGSTDSMVVILKNNSSKDSQNFVEIGRTEIVYNEGNPKYMKTFVFPFKWQNSQQLQFRIYHMINPKSTDLRRQKLLGKVNTNLYNLVENQKDQLQIKQISKNSSKAILKVNCSEYESANSYYQINMELTNFVFKSDVYFVIQSLKNGEVIPIAKSEVRKPSKFKEIKVPCNKFKTEDNFGIQIIIFDALKEQQIGSTKQFSISQNLQQKSQSHRVSHGGLFVGTVWIHKWKKVTRDSFLSYIVGGARLHLLLAIDFTNSNSSNGENLHTLDKNEQNVYINAIKEIVGVLQYFSIQNQVALYGFGAKLPPFYRSVSQCFALNGDYFHPNVEGGVDQIIKLYKQNLINVKMHGPTKISQIIELAIKYATEEEVMSTKSSTYYVLIIITDGKINDFQDTVDLIVKASSLPLSILFVGVGAGQQDNQKRFQMLQILDEKTLDLKSSKTGDVCGRDIVEFIRMSDFDKDSSKQALARETFSQIPNHFIDYMSSKNIKPLKQKKSLKAAKSEFIAQKIKSNLENAQPFVSSFLEKEKNDMKKKLLNLGISGQLVEKMKIAMNDLSYFIEVHSQQKKILAQQSLERTQYVNTKQIKKLQEFLEKKDQFKKTRTLEKLQKIEVNQYGYRGKTIKKQEQKKIEQKLNLENPCFVCFTREINVVHMQCGHSTQCRICSTARCPACYQINSSRKIFKYSQNGSLELEKSESSDNENEENYI